MCVCGGGLQCFREEGRLVSGPLAVVLSCLLPFLCVSCLFVCLLSLCVFLVVVLSSVCLIFFYITSWFLSKVLESRCCVLCVNVSGLVCVACQDWCVLRVMTGVCRITVFMSVC